LVPHRERHQPYTQQSISFLAYSKQGRDSNDRTAVYGASNQEETRERVQPTLQAQPAAPARRTAGAHYARLQDGLPTDMPRGTRSGAIHHVPTNNHRVESSEEEAANTTNPVMPAQTQPGANIQAPPGPANADTAQESPNPAPGNNPGATEPTPVLGILDDQPEMDIDYPSYQRRLKWLVNKKGLSTKEYDRERQNLEAVRLLLHDQGLLPSQTQVAHTPAAASVSTLSTTSKYREISAEISCKEELEVWKIKIKRKKIAIKILEKWFSAHAKEIGRAAWNTGDPGVIFDFYFVMFAKDIPMIETLAQEQLRALTITEEQRISDFLIVFRVVINVIECLDQQPMSERNKRLALERSFVRSNYHKFRYVFHNAKMLGLSFNRTIEFIEEIENEEFQMKEVYDFFRKNDHQQKGSEDDGEYDNDDVDYGMPESMHPAPDNLDEEDNQDGYEWEEPEEDNPDGYEWEEPEEDNPDGCEWGEPEEDKYEWEELKEDDHDTVKNIDTEDDDDHENGEDDSIHRQ
jgi:hypothetical protein